MIGELGIKNGEEKLAVVLHVLQLKIRHGDRLCSIFVGDNLQGATLGDITSLGRERPKVGVESDMHTRQRGKIRRDEVSQLVFSIHGFIANKTDDKRPLVVGSSWAWLIPADNKRTSRIMMDLFFMKDSYYVA